MKLAGRHHAGRQGGSEGALPSQQRGPSVSEGRAQHTLSWSLSAPSQKGHTDPLASPVSSLCSDPQAQCPCQNLQFLQTTHRVPSCADGRRPCPLLGEAPVICGLQCPALARSLDPEGTAASSDLQPLWEGENMSQCDAGAKTRSLCPRPSGCRASMAVRRCLGRAPRRSLSVTIGSFSWAEDGTCCGGGAGQGGEGGVGAPRPALTRPGAGLRPSHQVTM